MAVAIDITDSDIRLTRVENGRITAMEGYPIPADVDPLTALANAPLPQPLGPVRLSFSHPDMLMRVMLQPPAPPDRMGRIVRFELQNLGGEDETLINWHVPGLGGTGDMRILAQIAKRPLVDQISEALTKHQGRLASLVDPAVALFLGFSRNCTTDQGNQVIVDCGPDAVQMAFISEGELVFYRQHKPGLSDLVDSVAELRGLDRENAERLLRKLGSGAPDDMLDLIRRQGIAVATAISNNVRFAKTQLKLQEFDLHAVYVCGKAARLPKFTDYLAERLHVPVRLHNPFAGLLAGLPTEQMDSYAQLPSAWCGSLGLAAVDHVPLDVLEEVRAERRAFWQTSGTLRVASIAAAALMILAVLLQITRVGIQSSALESLVGETQDGLVPQAERTITAFNKQRAERAAIASRIRYLDNERRPARVVQEFLNVVAEIQHPQDLKVYVNSYRLLRPITGDITIELKGFAEDSADKLRRDEVLATFRKLLQQRYPVIGSIENRSPGTGGQTQLPFHWIITIPDRA